MKIFLTSSNSVLFSSKLYRYNRYEIARSSIASTTHIILAYGQQDRESQHLLNLTDWAWKPDAWYTMGYTAWLPGEPNNFRKEESCMILMHGQFGWNDDECQINHCSICEVELN